MFNKLLPGIAIGVGVWLLAKPAKASGFMPQRLTTFGGPTDLWDRGFDQAYLPPVKREGTSGIGKALETPAQYYARVPAWVREQMRPEMAKADSWPVMEQYYYRAGDAKNAVTRAHPVGLSYWLNDDMFRVAWDLRYQPDIEDARRGFLWCRIEFPGGTIRARVSDHGPSGANKKVLDVSPGVAKLIRPFWPQQVTYKLERLLEFEAKPLGVQEPMQLETTF